MPISLGQIVFGIGPDTTRLRTSISDITRFGQAVENAARAAAQGANNGADALMRQERAAISALQRVQRFQDQVRRSAAPANLVQGFDTLSTTGLDRFVARMTSGRLSAIQFQREMERLGVTMGNAQRIFNNWQSQSREGAMGTMAERLRQLSSAAVLVAGPLSGIATRISVLTTLTEHFNLTLAATVAGIAAGAYAFLKFSQSAIQVAKDFGKIETTLAAVSGSQAIAATQMKYLGDFANRAGVRIEDLGKSYSQMLAASKGTNLEGERTNKIFESITMAGSKLGLTNEEVEASLRAVQQMMSKGTVQAEELKGQLGDRIPGAVQVMADAVGVTTQKLFKLMEAGELSSSVLVKFADSLNKRYGINENTRIDTIIAAENRLRNARSLLIQQLDKVLGVSEAYKNTLNAITAAINGAQNSSRTLLPVLTGIAAALATGLASTAVITGMAAVAGGIRAITAAVASLNIAVAAGGAITALGALARLGVMIVGGLAGYYAMEKALKGTGSAAVAAGSNIDQYIEAQKTLKTTVRGTTEEMIRQQEALKLSTMADLTKAYSDMDRLSKQVDDFISRGASDKNALAMADRIGLTALIEKAREGEKILTMTGERIRALQDILARQTVEETRARNDPIKELTNRQTLAIKNARDTANELNAVYESMFKSPAAKEWAILQNDINKQIENFRDQLNRTEIPAAKVTELVDNYAAALRRVKEGEYALRTTTSYFQVIEGVFSRGLDQGLDAFTSAIFEGKDAMESLMDTAKYVAQDIFKTFMTLAALNPIKNMLFGTNYNTLGGSAGIGGLLGGLFSGSGGSGTSTLGYNPIAGAFNFAKGGVMTEYGSLPLNRYASGGVANSPQMAMFGEGRGPEAYVPLPDGRSIPVNMKGGGGGNAEIHIHESSGSKADVKATKGSNGQMRYDVYLRDMVKGIMMEDIAAGGEISNGMERQYGLNRTVGLSR